MSKKADLVIQPICNVPTLKSEYEPHGVRDITQASPTRSLLTCHANIDQDPKNETWSELIERFHVKVPNRRVEFATNEELIDYHVNQHFINYGRANHARHRYGFLCFLRGRGVHPIGRRLHSMRDFAVLT
jgi:hypothetical protein